MHAAGVGPWDGWVRAGKSVLPQPLPLTLGSDFAGVVAALGTGAAEFAPGDKVFGVTNPRFTGAYPEYASAAAGMIAKKPTSLTHVDAASVPVVAVTAWQALLVKVTTSYLSRIAALIDEGQLRRCHDSAAVGGSPRSARDARRRAPAAWREDRAERAVSAECARPA